MAAVPTQTPEMKGQQWIDETGKIQEAFDLFDKDKTSSIIQEVGTMLRAHGAYPDERQLVLTYLPEMQDGNRPALLVMPVLRM